MIRSEIEQHLDGMTNLSKDRWGNYKWSENGNNYRIKFLDKVIRLEKEIVYDENCIRAGEKSWIKLSGDYYKNIVVKSDGRLKIGRLLFGKKVKV